MKMKLNSDERVALLPTDGNSAIDVTDPNVATVMRRMAVRAHVGLATYGVDTTRNDLTLDGWLAHLQDELLDAAIYVQVIRQRVRKSNDG